MTNPLTGDFEAVLQINGGTFTRLMASLHQNGADETSRASVPHVAHFRLEDTGEGVHGSVAASIGVPGIRLVDGSRDRFALSFPFRARYRSDPDAVPLADIVAGTVKADYVLGKVDPFCLGWSDVADDFVWLHVVKETVRFEGSFYNETNLLALTELMATDEIRRRIERQIADLLEIAFAPQPFRLDASFRRFLAKAQGGGPAQSALAFPYDFSGGPAHGGQLASLAGIPLGGRDVTLAIAKEPVLARIAPHLDAVVGLQRDLHVHGDAGVGGGLEIDYHVRVDAASVEWIGPVSLPVVSVQGCVVRARVTGSGWATRLYRSGVYNIGKVHIQDLAMGFTVEQLVVLDFDGATERLTVEAIGGPMVSIGYGGPYAAEIRGTAQGIIEAQTKPHLDGALAAARAELAANGLAARKAAVVEQLKRVDAGAAIRFTDAQFSAYGIVLAGTVVLSRRRSPRIRFERFPQRDGFDAIESWIPGGHVERYEWSWRWHTTGAQKPPGPPGGMVEKTVTTLRRPAKLTTKFGLVVPADQPLPGLDGAGQVCLRLRGRVVDPVSGAVVAVETEVECRHFGYQFRWPVDLGPYLEVYDPFLNVELPRRRSVLNVSEPLAEAGNLLLVRPGRDEIRSVVEDLRDGLDQVRHENAGLMVLILYGHDDAGQVVAETLAEFWADPPAVVLPVKDLRGSWSAAAGVPDDDGRPSWRLFDGNGLSRWAHDDRCGSERLASALDRFLLPGNYPRPSLLKPKFGKGDRFVVDLSVRKCPPMPLTRSDTGTLRLVALHRDDVEALAGPALQTLVRAEDGAKVVLVVDGATEEEARAVGRSVDPPLDAFADPDGTLTRSLGARASPAIVVVDAEGLVADQLVGARLFVGADPRTDATA